jgi:hypothetical protein
MCDGLFLIEDTAKHLGVSPDPVEVIDHIMGCVECSTEMEDSYGDYAEEVYDPDAPIAFWPDDAYLANYQPHDRLEELDGHA